jgi:DNA-binding CsgD family transcriptional regulator
MGDFHVAGGNGRMAEPAELQLRLFRRGCEPPFSDEEQALCAMLVPHLVRAVRLSSRLRLTESELSFYAKALDRMLVGAVILDEKGHLLRATATAEAILGGRDGIRILGGRPHAEAPGEDRELQQIIRQALAAGTGEEAPARAISLTRPSGARNLGVVVQPIRQSDILAGPGRAAVALFIRDPERSAEIESEVLGRLFDFTPAEAAIARCFADGMSLERAASELDISRNTVRAHLRSIFSKSGISRQTELVRLLLNSAAVLGPAGRLGAHAAH